MKKINVLLVDDQTLFVESLRIVLQTRAKDINVVGVAYDGLQALKFIAREASSKEASSKEEPSKELPDVVLMDVRMPQMDGVECTRQIKKNDSGIRVLMLTTFDDDEYAIRALEVGAEGYLLKNVPPEELLAAIRLVYQGAVSISPKVAAKLVGKIRAEKPDEIKTGHDKDVTEWFKELTAREREILRFVTQGHTNPEIAKELCIEEQTVKNHISNIFSKLGVRNRVQASQIAREAGLK